MPIVTRVNLPIRTSNHIFLNREGLERLKKIMPKRRLINKEVHNFQNTQEEDVQIVWHHLKQKRNSIEKRLHPKKKVVKVEEDEVDRNEERKKNWEDCNVKALVILCGEMEHKFVMDAKKKVRFQSLQCVSTHVHFKF